MIIGVSGKINSGKDTVGQIVRYLTSDYYENNISYKRYLDKLDSEWGPPQSKWEIKKFADKLKDIVCLLIGCTKEQLEDEQFKNTELGEEWNKYELHLTHNANRNWKSTNIFNSEVEANKYAKGHCSYKKGYTIKVIKLTPRKLLQLIGTDVGRVIHPNAWMKGCITLHAWINATMRDYNYYTFGKTNINNGDLVINSNKEIVLVDRVFERTFEDKDGNLYMCNNWSTIKYPNWVITDVRFPNEIKAIEDRGGITIRVNRPRILKHSENVSYEFNPLLDYGHPSETALDNAEFDYVIENNSDIQSLIKKVKTILEKENII